jgi:hypothetical protein
MHVISTHPMLTASAAAVAGALVTGCFGVVRDALARRAKRKDQMKKTAAKKGAIPSIKAPRKYFWAKRVRLDVCAAVGLAFVLGQIFVRLMR